SRAEPGEDRSASAPGLTASTGSTRDATGLSALASARAMSRLWPGSGSSQTAKIVALLQADLLVLADRRGAVADFHEDRVLAGVSQRLCLAGRIEFLDPGEQRSRLRNLLLRDFRTGARLGERSLRRAVASFRRSSSALSSFVRAISSPACRRSCARTFGTLAASSRDIGLLSFSKGSGMKSLMV